MATQVAPPPAPAADGKRSASFLTEWKPEDPTFWAQTGSKVAWRTLIITTLTLVLSFSTWFILSVLSVNFWDAGIRFAEDKNENSRMLFWLVAMPGLAGGSLRVIHTFLIPIFGTRAVITWSTLLKLIPCIGIAWCIITPGTPYGMFMLFAFLLGMGGGDFSSYMPSTSLFFPKRLQGTALGIQAGVGNFGVSLTQFVTPWIITVAGIGLIGGSQTSTVKKGAEVVTKTLWMQNAALWYVPLLVLLGAASWFMLRSVPVKASFREQLDIFKSKHTWFCTITYVMTFGSFSGFSAAFALMMKEMYAGFPDGPVPVKYAYLGPLIGSTVRVIFGFISDKTGGGILTTLAGVGMIGCCVVMWLTGAAEPTSLETWPLFLGLMLAIFFFSGMGNASTFRQYPLIFAHNPRQGAQVLGWTGAVAAYGPFLFSVAIGEVIAATAKAGTKSATPFFIGAAVFYLIATALNWYYYQRKGCERPS